MKVNLISSFLAFCVNVLVNSQLSIVENRAKTAAYCSVLISSLSSGERRILNSGGHYGSYSSSKTLQNVSRCIKLFGSQAAFGGYGQG